MLFFRNKLFTNQRRIAILILIAVGMNLVLFSLAYTLNWPLWLDTTGTIYISCILGSPVGFLVAIINNIIQAIWAYGSESLLFYFVSLLTAFTAGYTYKRLRDTGAVKWIVMILALMIVDGVSAVLITVMVNGGIPSNYWSFYFYTGLRTLGYPGAAATVLSVLAVKLPDILVTVLIVIVSIRLTPRRLKTAETVILNSCEDTVR